MASLTPTGLETITYGQQGWNAIVTANMQRLNAWLGKMLPLMDNRSRTEGAVPMVERRQRQLGAVQRGAVPANGTGGPQVPRGGAGGSGGRAAFRLGRLHAMLNFFND